MDAHRTNGTEDCYPLSPIQQSMLDESLAATAGGRIGLLQLVWDLPEPLDLEAFRRAWESVVERHPILRTRFVWTGCPEPFQEVLSQASLTYETRDWSGSPPERHEEMLHELLVEDRQRGMELDRAPLLRVTVARLGPAHHRVLVTLHHNTFDGRTVLALAQEVFAFYNGKTEGLPTPGLYRRYIEWLGQQDRRRAEAFWREALRGINEPTPLGIDLPERERARAQESREGSAVWFYQDFQIWLSEESTNELLAFANGLGITLNTLLLGAWGLLLSRYSGRPDVLFGVVRTHRGPLADESMIMGPVMNSVPFRASPSRRNDVVSFLQEVRSHWVDMRTGDFATAAEIRGWSELDPQAPFFETLVLFETHEFSERLRRQGGGWENRSFLFFRQPRVPLSIYGYIEKRLSLKVIFDPGRFDAATMRRLLEHLRAVLEMLPAAADQPAADLPLLTAAESQQLLVEWNDTGAAASPSPVHRRFEEQARRAPHALAVSGPDGARTYGQLEESANRLAWLLSARGVGPGSVVAVLLERSVQETEALLAILKAGGAYLPLDGSAPERLDWILEDSGATVLLTRSALDRLEEELHRQPASPPPVPDSPELPAYVIYTSGSTGRPKGVVVPHRGLGNLVDWHLNAFGVTAADRASRLAGLGFDASVWELWPYWSAGAAILLPPEEIRADAPALRDWLVREAVTIGFAPTPMAERLVELSWPPETALRLLLTGGDALRNAPPAGLPFRLVNNYGPTESSVVATSGPVAALSGEEARGRLPGIGRPVGNLRIHLVDSGFRAVPLGARGELTIAGPGLAQGYLGRPELTAASFLPDPFGGPGERMYCTGDLARFLPDGQIEFLGRRDSQIKLRGFRIEPGEIEAAIDRHPSVQSCAILARGSGMDDDKQLVAFLVRRPGSPDGDIDLHGFLRGRLPAYMIPRLYTWIDSLPLNTSGKVDRKALEAAADAVSGRARDHVPPETPVERLLAQIWEDVLGHSPVGLRDDFFALGGSSLDVMQVLAALRNIFQRDIPADLVFVASTIEQLVPNLFPEAAERDDAERVAESVLQDVPG